MRWRELRVFGCVESSGRSQFVTSSTAVVYDPLKLRRIGVLTLVLIGVLVSPLAFAQQAELGTAVALALRH